MSLPIVILKTDEKWDCHQCGFCCRGTTISLSGEDVERLRGQKWDQEPEFRNTPIMIHGRGPVGAVRLAHRKDGSCVFLGDDGLCRIHSRFGMEAKPTVCQSFPLQIIPHDKQAVLTVRRSCPSAAADLGDSIATRLPLIKQLVRGQRLKAEPIPPPRLKAGEARPWKPVRAVLDTVGNLLQDERYPPVRRLVHALQFAHLLELAKTKNMSDMKIEELARTLAELAPEESRYFFTDRRPPGNLSRIMFQLMGVSVARLHPAVQHRVRWSARLELMRTAWRVARGSGKLPYIDDKFPDLNFDQLEEPLGALPAETYRPLARFIEMNSATWQYAIAGRRGWSVVESIRGLAILFPVGLWLLRWLAHGRPSTVQDTLNLVVALDRSQSHEPLCGPLQRWRLSILSGRGELERLVVWYAR